MKLFPGTLLFSVILLLGSCSHEPDLAGIPDVSFDKEIRPLVVSQCAYSDCHSSGGEEFPLTNYDEIRSKVTPGDARSSDLYRAVTHRPGSDPMPPSGYPDLSDRDLKLLFIWIEQGAKNN